MKRVVHAVVFLTTLSVLALLATPVHALLPPGSALSFDGTDDFVTMGDVLMVNQDFTIELWMCSTSTADAFLLAKHQCGSWNGYIIHLNMDGGGQGAPGHVYFYVSGGLLVSRSVLNDGRWHHLACVYSHLGSMALYVDGALEASGWAPTTITANSQPLCPGSCCGGGWYGGELDDIRFWTVARSGDEILRDMNTPLAGTEPGLEAYWNLDEGAGQVAHDLTGHGYDGQLGTTADSDCSDPTWQTLPRTIDLLNIELWTDRTLYFRGEHPCPSLYARVTNGSAVQVPAWVYIWLELPNGSKYRGWQFRKPLMLKPGADTTLEVWEVDLPPTAPTGSYTFHGELYLAKPADGMIVDVCVWHYRNDAARYQTLVPDTLDLAERGELAINAITRTVEPASGYLDSYFGVNIDANPPYMWRLFPHTKEWDALALLRLITDSDLNLHVDDAWADILAQWGEQARPYEPVTGPRALMLIGTYYMRTNDPIWTYYGDRLVSQWWSEAVDMGTYCYFPWGPNGEMEIGWPATFHGWLLEGLVHYYLATGNQLAYQFASKVARYLKDYAQIFDADGHFLATHDSERGPALHFHHNANSMQALGWYAWASRDPEYAEFVREGYEYAKSVSTPVVGYYPEYIGDQWPDWRPMHNTEVGCDSRDMMDMAILLSRLEVGDYWEDVDQAVRNMFAESQMLSYQWMYDISSGYPYDPGGPVDSHNYLVPERNLGGGFGGWAMPNDLWLGPGYPLFQHCDLGNGPRVLYTVWRNILDFSAGALRVNLLLNRASPWADLNSYIPYQGKVDLRIKRKASSVSIRIPNWVPNNQVSCTVNGTPRAFSWGGRYISLGAVKAGDLVQVSFPIGERTVAATIGDQPYTLIIKGNEVVSIDPPGTYYPLFQRAQYRENVAHWKTVTRVVPSGELPW